MTKVDFYYDPSCPFCWITSRWLLQVSAQRKIDITWRPFSLAMKNDELTQQAGESKYAAASRSAHRVARVIEAARQQGAAAIDLYAAFGRRHHVGGSAFDDAMIQEVLAEQNLPAELAAAADDASHDAQLAAELQSAIDVVGQDIGAPTIVFYLQGGSKQGYFGPVLQELPDVDESLRIWDGVAQLASSTSFYELKSTRPSGGPNVASTAKS